MVGFIVEAAQIAFVLPNVLLLIDPFALYIQFQVVFEERGGHHDASRVAFRVVCA